MGWVVQSIVTADIHGDLDAELRLAANKTSSSFRIGHVSLPIRRLDDLAESCVFVKQSVNAIYCDSSLQHCCSSLEYPFSRSYGANVPSSLERFLSRALVYSTHPPVSVYGTGSRGNNPKLFSANCPVIRFARRLSSAFDCLVTFLFAHFRP